MKFRASIIFFLLVCCVGLGYWHRSDLGLIWQEYSSAHRHFEYRDYLRYRKPLIGSATVRKFPEEALMLEIMLNSYEPYERIEMLSEGALAYPDNEYFAFKLADELLACGRYMQGLDLKLPLMLADKLIELNPENANYHYLRAYTLLQNKASIEDVLDELHTGNESRLVEMPVEQYRKRLEATAKNEKMGVSFSEHLDFAGKYDYFSRKLSQELIGRAGLAFAEGDKERGIGIDDALKGYVGKLQRAKEYARLRVSTMETLWGGFGRSTSPQLLELKRANISKDRIDKNRLELCAMNYREKPKAAERRSSKDDFGQQEYLVFPVLVHSAKMFVALIILVLLALPFSMKGVFLKESKIGITSFRMFLYSGLCFFVAAQYQYLHEIIGFSTCCHYTYLDAFRPGIGLDVYFDEWLVLTGFMVGPVLVLLLLKGLGAIKVRKERLWRLWNFRLGAFVICKVSGWLSKSRFVCIIVAAIFWAIPAMSLSGYRYWCYFPVICFVITALAIAFRKPNSSFFKRYFSGGLDGAAFRGRCFCLMLMFIVVYWIAFIFSVPKSSAMIRSYARPRPEKKYEIYEANEETYQKLLARFDDPELRREDIHKLAALLRAKDLGGILGELKQREFARDTYPIMHFPCDPNTMRFGPMGSAKGKKGYKSRKRSSSRFNDKDIYLLLRNSGRDTVEILADHLERPNLERALVERAKAGDVRVRDKLVKLWEKKMKGFASDEAAEFERWLNKSRHKSYMERPVRVDEMLGGLCNIVESDQAAAYLVEYIEIKDFERFEVPHEFYESISLLPREQGTSVLKALWDRIKRNMDREKGVDRMFWGFEVLGGLYGDRELCEDIFREWLLPVDEESEIDIRLLPDFFTKDSTELLKEGLASENDDLRAWSVQQLNSIGYNWSKDEVTGLLSDESYKVRANIMVGAPEANLKAGEKSSIVRLAVSLAGQL